MYNLSVTNQLNKLFEQQPNNYLNTASITEVIYQSPLYTVLQQQLPLLCAIGQQPRWQLWISSQPILRRDWIEMSGLSINKVIQLPNIESKNRVQVIEKALLSGNFSYVLANFADICLADKQRLSVAAKKGNTHLFIISERCDATYPTTIYH